MQVTVVFPGQGTQYVGMGKEFSDSSDFLKANQSLGYDLKTLMLEGPAEMLKLTENTQPAIVLHSLMLFKKLFPLLESKGISIKRVLGHSVGEYAALSAAGVLSMEEAVKAVHFRGKFMQEASPAGVGTMYAILKQEEELIRKACLKANTSQEKVSAANFNEPQQIVISGHKKACERALAYIEEQTQSRVKAIELQVSAPFHCELMKPAELRLSEILNSLTFHASTLPYVANVDATEYSAQTPPDVIKANLLKQVCASVLWTQSIQKLPNETLIIECGPGKVLAGLIKKINPNIKVISLDTETGLSEVEAL